MCAVLLGNYEIPEAVQEVFDEFVSKFRFVLIAVVQRHRFIGVAARLEKLGSILLLLI